MAISNGNGSGTVTNRDKENSAVALALKHNVGLSVDWSRHEQSVLEDLLVQYASDKPVLRYAKIARKLEDKTVRDVALRCRWMSKKEIGKRRKDDSRRHRDKREKAMDLLAKPSAHTTNQGNGLPYAQASISIDSDDGISYKDIGGLSGQLLEENAQALEQISANFSSFKVHENISLISQTRNNILSILNDLNDAPEIMKQMPPLPVKLNDELADSILLQSSMPMKFESFRI